jgi:hypothetical protein
VLSSFQRLRTILLATRSLRVIQSGIMHVITSLVHKEPQIQLVSHIKGMYSHRKDIPSYSDPTPDSAHLSDTATYATPLRLCRHAANVQQSLHPSNRSIRDHQTSKQEATSAPATPSEYTHRIATLEALTSQLWSFVIKAVKAHL